MMHGVLLRVTIYFLAYSFLGWIVDTGFRSIMAGQYAPGTLIPFFAIIYGFGALFILSLEGITEHRGLIAQFFIFALLCTIVEYIGGMTALEVTGHRLWDYSSNDFNINGMVSLFHSVCWGILSLFLIHVLHPRVKGLYDRYMVQKT